MTGEEAASRSTKRQAGRLRGECNEGKVGARSRGEEDGIWRRVRRRDEEARWARTTGWGPVEVYVS
jgi:hypothetical protein